VVCPLFNTGGSAFNPVKTTFDSIPGGYGPILYSGADLATSLGVGFVKVPLAMGKGDGLNRTKSIFGVMVSRMDNNFYIPLTYKPTPYGTAGAIYLLGVGGKGYDLGNKIIGGQEHEN
jgi:filamentous hemagglutinin